MKRTAPTTATSLNPSSERPGKASLAKAPMPMRAKALMREMENQSARPPMVPATPPKPRVTNICSPPALGMAVDSSATENMVGTINRPATR
ncbi:MAG: hypothetical protein NTW26_09520 [bacterium]|nr:hypothetical protein [bacterium]